MKKFLTVLFFVFVGLPPAYGSDYFVFDVTANTILAGSSFTVDISAKDSLTNLNDPAYTGRTAYLSASSGPGTFTPATPIMFTGGSASGISIVLYGAGSINLTVTDGVYNTITSVAGWRRVMPQTAQSVMVLHHSSEIQEYLTPGKLTGPGFEEVHGYVGVTLSSGIPVAVSICSVDQYHNVVTGTACHFNFLCNGPHDFDADTVTGFASWIWTPTVLSDTPEQQDFTNWSVTWYSSPGYPPVINGRNYIFVPSVCYLWTEAAPSSVVANVPFFLTVTATTNSDRNSAIAAWVNYDFALNPKQYYVINSPGRGSLVPGYLRLNNGVGYATCTYKVAETIEIVPTISDTSAVGKTFKTGGYAPINILPAAPASMSVAVTPANIQAQKTATLLVTVRDVYQNVVPGVVVNFEKTAGSADASVSPSQVTTDTNGVATATFRGGIINEIATIRMTVGTVSQTTDIRISVAPPSGGEMINYPNPFNPNNQKTSINYYLKDASKVEIRIYDAFGRVVLSRTLSPGEGSGDFFNATVAGGASFMWDGRNGEGHMVGNGIYTVKVTARNSVEMQKFTRRVGVLK
ncbi:MAG: T9SS type A sorting domain-containing protein [Candidatus Firestonebacteria bacterium]|nr:T9SS type A sorting domain-containing protein [Candidatus Firestonebacteria bacterium]